MSKQKDPFQLPKSQLRLDLDQKKRHWTFYCPLCAVSRSLKQHPQPGQPIHFVQIGLCALMFTLICFPLFKWKGLVSFVPMWIVFEGVYRMRMRAQLRCQECGFDPLLAMTDLARAKRDVAQHWERKLATSKAPNPSLTATTPEG